MNTFRFSVLMSVYKDNDPDQFKTALQSIYEDQTKKPDEIVIVLDGPISRELEIVLHAFCFDKSDIVKIVPLENNCGLGEALRIGSKHCDGDYIFRMDSDDISHPNRFDVQSRYIEQHPEIDVLGTDIAEFEQTLHEPMRVRACPDVHEDIVKMAKKRNPMNHVSVCIRREALMKSGGYEEVPLLEDYYLWLKMIVMGYRFANLNESLVFVRLGNDFNKKRGSKRRVKGWRTLQNYMLEHGMINWWNAFVNMISIYGFVYCPTFVRKLAYTKFLRG